MRRNKYIEHLEVNNIAQHKKRIAFHESGHAIAIHEVNKKKHYPIANFKITFNNNLPAEEQALIKESDYSAKVSGGRLVKHLPDSVEPLINTPAIRLRKIEHQCQDFLAAFKIDIINLLIGPLAEAKCVALADDEIFNRQLISLQSLHNYGGSLDLETVERYLYCLSNSAQERTDILNSAFNQAFDFIDNIFNWQRINCLAKHIINNEIATLDYPEINHLLMNHNIH